MRYQSKIPKIQGEMKISPHIRSDLSFGPILCFRIVSGATVLSDATVVIF
jgi:hypothetical protein